MPSQPVSLGWDATGRLELLLFYIAFISNLRKTACEGVYNFINFLMFIEIGCAGELFCRLRPIFAGVQLEDELEADIKEEELPDDLPVSE